MIRDISIDIWFCVFILDGSSLTLCIPVGATYLMTVQIKGPSDSLQNEKNRMIISVSVV